MGENELFCSKCNNKNVLNTHREGRKRGLIILHYCVKRAFTAQGHWGDICFAWLLENLCIDTQTNRVSILNDNIKYLQLSTHMNISSSYLNSNVTCIKNHKLYIYLYIYIDTFIRI